MVLNREQIYSVNPVEHNIFGEKKPFISNQTVIIIMITYIDNLKRKIVSKNCAALNTEIFLIERNPMVCAKKSCVTRIDQSSLAQCTRGSRNFKGYLPFLTLSPPPKKNISYERTLKNE